MNGTRRMTGEVDVVRVRAWLLERGVGEACPLCQSKNLQVGRTFFSLSPWPHEPVGHETLLVRLRCGQCANVSFFHARQMGLTP